MKLLLAPNICIYIIKKKPPEVLAKFNDYTPGDITISTITVAELEYGVQKSDRPAKNQAALQQYIVKLYQEKPAKRF